MRHSIDYKLDVYNSLFFWIKLYMRSKVNSLSNRQVKSQTKLTVSIQTLKKDCDDMDKLKQTIKDIRNNGLIGVATYFHPLNKLYDYVYQNYDSNTLKNIDEEFLSEFLVTNTASLSDATKKNYRITIIGFFSFLDKQNQDTDGKSHIYRIELKGWGGITGGSGVKLPSFMDENEIKKFIQAIDTYKFKPEVQHRNKLIIKIILYTGIRVSEAININIKDIIEKDGYFTIKIVGKGNKQRTVLLKLSHIKSDLQMWLDTRTCQSDALFCTKTGSRLLQSYVSRTVENILRSCGIKKEKNGAHMLRHSFATLLYNKSQDLILVQEALGHASLDTSKIYTHFDNNKLKTAANMMDDM
ncbi:MAG: integrase [Epsilonproteobacteria bacterium]|nr:MAG: integrase [Campylobacterota bacterium]